MQSIKQLVKADTVHSWMDNSNPNMKRLRIRFKNGYGLSIVQGEYSYGGPEGLFEIAPINKEQKLDGSLLDLEDQGDDVLGYCTLERVSYYINKIGGLGD